ncbi:MAG: hypothetical protein JEY99_11800 [Spirochaetales bacterium]|nr:hypothetical protein [Spirochaetales bacterium]
MNKITLLLIILFTLLSFSYSQNSNISVKLFTDKIDAVYQAGNDTTLVFDFDEESANKQNSWIEIYFDGEMARMCAGGDLKAPFSFDIPGRALTVGKHKVEFKIISRSEGDPATVIQAEIILKAIE